MKRPRRKRILCILAILLLALLLAYLCLPHYARQALIHLMPVIDDLETFHRDTVRTTWRLSTATPSATMPAWVKRLTPLAQKKRSTNATQPLPRLLESTVK